MGDPAGPPASLAAYALPPLEVRTVGHVLDARAMSDPDKLALTDGTRSFTYRQLLDEAHRFASGFQELGLQRGDTVVTMLRSHSDAVLTWISLALAGAVAVPVNPAYQGRVLEHAITDSRATTIIAEQEHLDVLAALRRPDPSVLQVVVRGDRAPGPAGGRLRCSAFDDLPRAPHRAPGRNEPWDSMALMYTSGTTGTSKGVLTSEAHAYGYATPAALGMPAADDEVLVVLPLHHVAGLLSGVYGAFIAGATAHVRPFSVSSFWTDVRETGATCTLLVDAMVKFLLQASDGAPRRSTLRRVSLAPISDASNQFMERFGLEQCCSGYGSTEASSPVVAPLGSTSLHNTIGWARPDFEVEVVDERDRGVPDGEVGELVLRPREPWTMMDGYWEQPAATAACWRNLWYHTGDLVVRREVDGQLVFQGRMHDAIRRRSENISAVAIEQEAMACAGVAEAVAVGVPDPGSGQEVLLAVQLEGTPPAKVEESLLDVLSARLPRFMVPRYVRVVSDFERSVSGKVRRATLREEGLSAGTWDREAGEHL